MVRSSHLTELVLILYVPATNLVPSLPNYPHLLQVPMLHASLMVVHTEKIFWNLVNSTRNQIVFTIFRLIWKKVVN